MIVDLLTCAASWSSNVDIRSSFFRSSSWMSQTTTENRRLLHHHRLALFFLPHILFSRCNVSGKESNSFTFLFDVSNKMMGTILPSMMCFPHINEFPLTNYKRLLRL